MSYARCLRVMSGLFLLLFSGGACQDEVVKERSPSRESNFVHVMPGEGHRFEMVWVEEAQGWIGRHEVTWEEFLLYCDFDATSGGGSNSDAVARPSRPLEVHPYDHDWGEGDRPALGMSWQSATLFCKWLSRGSRYKFRLPSEREWRLACGEVGAESVPGQAWTAADQHKMTQPVGSKESNVLGIYDMLGNVAEYCAAEDGKSAPNPVVLLGGSWASPLKSVTPQTRLIFDDDWTLDDPGFPPGKWWIPGGNFIGFRVFCQKKND